MAQASHAAKPEPVSALPVPARIVRLERGGQTIHFHTRKVESLLRFSRCIPRRIRAKKLAALFWGDVSDEQARVSLRVALSTLRKELGDDLMLPT